MTRVRGAGPDRACVLPGRPGWIQDAAYLGATVLEILADVAEANAFQDELRYGLTAVTYRTASLTITSLAASVPEGEPDQVVLLPLPAWKVEALWDVPLVLRRTVAGDPDTWVLGEFLTGMGSDLFTPARTVERFAADLEKVMAVLMLDLPAVKVVATAVALDGKRGQEVAEAYRQISEAWTAAGVRH